MIEANVVKDNLNYKAEVLCFDSIDSTSNEIKRQLELDADKSLLVIAQHQSCGRGRQGKSFLSPKDAGLYMSMTLDIGSSFDHIVTLTSYIAVCVAKALRITTGKDARIKWVNDIYIENKKVCGILTEAFTKQGQIKKVIIGIGINLYPFDVPEELKNVVGFVCPTQDISNDLVSIIFNTLHEYDLTNQELNKYIISDAKSLSCVLGRSISFTQDGIVHYGVATDIYNDGALEVKTEDGIVLLRSGEISLRMV